jgi:AcrR family transcriptional regulator
VTRQTILAAARAAFAADGYERATVRAIASRAGVDPALVHHHFGTKEDLFVAAHDFPISPARLAAALTAAEGTLGERVARLYLTAAFTEGSTFQSLIGGALTNPTARDLLRQFIERGILDTIVPRLPAPDARIRVLLAGSHLVGLFLMRRVLGVEPLRDTDLDYLVAVVGPTIDRYLTGDLGRLAGSTPAAAGPPAGR